MMGHWDGESWVGAWVLNPQPSSCQEVRHQWESMDEAPNLVLVVQKARHADSKYGGWRGAGVLLLQLQATFLLGPFAPTGGYAAQLTTVHRSPLSSAILSSCVQVQPILLVSASRPLHQVFFGQPLFHLPCLHSHEPESARPNLLRCFWSPWCPVRKWRMAGWAQLLSSILVWSCCGLYLSFLVFCSSFCFCCASKAKTWTRHLHGHCWKLGKHTTRRTKGGDYDNDSFTFMQLTLANL